MRDGSHGLRPPQPFKIAAQRLGFFALVAVAFALMLVGKADTVLVEAVRSKVADAVTPILDGLSRPLGAVSKAVEGARELAVLRDENAELRARNQTLLEWQARARALEAENARLRALLNYEPPAAARQITVRVVADSGAAFVRALLVNAGRRDGVRKGQAAVTGAGLIGRVAEVGTRSARILLITDLNARIPVVVERTRDRAILAGDNTDRPRLVYLGPDAVVAAGDRVVTSGHGGVFPPGIPVGSVVDGGDGQLRVRPVADWARLENLRLLDFGLDGIIGPPEADAMAAEATPDGG